VWDLRFWQPGYLQLKSSGMLHHAECYIVTYVSKENTGFIVAVKQSVSPMDCLSQIDCWTIYKLTEYNIPEGMYLQILYH
jgi:hypothetical protein